MTEYGGPETLHEVDVPREPFREGTVRVRVTAAAVNPTDTHVRNGARAEGDRSRVAVTGAAGAFGG